METKQNSFRETMEWKIGEIGRNVVIAALQEKGWYIIPSDDYIGEDEKAPRLFGKVKQYVLPDLDVAQRTVRRWGEVKTKAEATWTHITQRLEHGFAKRLFDHYLEVQSITGTEVWVFVYERKTNTLLYARLNDLPKPRVYLGNKMDRGGMVFFPRNAFITWGTGLDWDIDA
jgi:hypothetical protein